MLHSKNIDIALLLLRITFGGLMLVNHGWGKLLRLIEDPSDFGDPIGLGAPISLGLTVFAEFFCAVFVAIGLFTRYAVVPLIITMLVAAFIVHADDPFGKIEKALMFLTAYISIGLAGPGWYSMDEQWRKI